MTRLRVAVLFSASVLLLLPAAVHAHDAPFAAGPPALPTPPPLPTRPSGALSLVPAMAPQSSAPAQPCSLPAMPAGRFQVLFTVADGESTVPPTVDPWNPCRIYRVFRTANGANGAVERVTLGARGVSRTPVFSPPQNTLVQGGAATVDFFMSSPVITAPDDVRIYDRGQTLGVVRSHDAGARWVQESQGLVPVPGSEDRINLDQHLLVFSRSNLSVGYLAYPRLATDGFASVADNKVASLLFKTVDGGASWSQVQAVPGVAAAITVDPLDSNHVIVGISNPPALWETLDGALTWRLVSLPVDASKTGVINALGDTVTQVMSSHAGAGLRLYVEINRNVSSLWLRGDESPAGQISWKPLDALAIDALSTASSVAVDPLSDRGVAALLPDLAAGVERQVRLVYTDDGFDTTSITTLSVPLPWQGGADVAPSTRALKYVTVELDHYGDAFLWLGSSWSLEKQSLIPLISEMLAFRADSIGAARSANASPGGSPASDTAAGGPGGGQNSGGSTSGGGPGGSQSGTTPVPPAHDFGSPRAHCTLPLALTPTGEPLPPGAASHAGSTSGSLAFDGRYLLYTTATTEDPTPSGLIGRLDPLTCRSVSTLALAAGDFPNGHLPTIEELAYDPNFTFSDDGSRGAILAAGRSGQDPRLVGDQTPIYAIKPATGQAVLLYGVASGADPFKNLKGLGDPYFSYDPFSDQLWHYAAEPDGLTQPGLTAAPREMGDDTSIPTCMTQLVNSLAPVGTGAEARNVGTWAVGGPGEMYLSMEDDKTIVKVDSRDCTILDVFQHAFFGEPSEENEQMACDAMTFPTNVLWFRDTSSNGVVAFAIPNGSCPGPAGTPTIPATTAVSGFAPFPPVFQAPPSGSVIQPPPAGQPQPAGAGQVQVQSQGQAQAQAQAQAQTQSQSQSQAQSATQIQPGVMVQRQKRAQVAVQQQTAVTHGLQASALPRCRALIFGLAPAFLMLGFGSVRRRPGLAMARRHHRVADDRHRRQT